MGNTGINNHTWRKLRHAWAAKIDMAATQGRPITCPRCHQPIHPGHDWDLGHKVDRADGGTTHTGTHPEHAHCNRSAGAQRQRPRTRNW